MKQLASICSMSVEYSSTCAHDLATYSPLISRYDCACKVLEIFRFTMELSLKLEPKGDYMSFKIPEASAVGVVWRCVNCNRLLDVRGPLKAEKIITAEGECWPRCDRADW